MDDTTQQDSEISAVDSLHEALGKDDIELARDKVATLHPSEIADVIESMPGRDRDSVWQLIDPELEGDAAFTHAGYCTY